MARVHECLIGSGVPKKFWGKKFEEIIMRSKEIVTAVNTVRGYLNTLTARVKDGSSCFLCGTCGTGKTMLACMMVEYACRKGYYGHYTTAFKMIQTLRKGYSKGDSVQIYIRQYVAYDLLVIDEIGVQHGSNDERVLLYQIIDDRYLCELPTVIISNSTNPVEDGYLDKRTIDRIEEGNGFSLIFRDESFRSCKR